MRGCRDKYDKIVPVDAVVVPKNLINEIREISEDEWKNYSKNLNNIKEVKLRDFQFKINNQIFVTNTFLFKTKKKENNLCSYCNQEAESITHLLFHCETVAKFWKTLKIWLERKSNINIQIVLKEIFFHHLRKLCLVT